MLEPFRYFILVSEAKSDLRGQRSYFEKGLVDDENAAQFDEKHFWKGLMKISRIVYEIGPFKDFILASEVKGHF